MQYIYNTNIFTQLRPPLTVQHIPGNSDERNHKILVILKSNHHIHVNDLKIKII